MKTKKKLVLDHLGKQPTTTMDPLQLAYQPCMGDGGYWNFSATQSLPPLEHRKHYENHTLWLSSAFNIIQPTLLGDKLRALQYSGSRTTQLAKLADYPNWHHWCSSGDCSGSLPLHFLHHISGTELRRATWSIKVGKEEEYWSVINSLVEWC